MAAPEMKIEEAENIPLNKVRHFHLVELQALLMLLHCNVQKANLVHWVTEWWQVLRVNQFMSMGSRENIY